MRYYIREFRACPSNQVRFLTSQFLQPAVYLGQIRGSQGDIPETITVVKLCDESRLRWVKLQLDSLHELMRCLGCLFLKSLAIQKIQHLQIILRGDP